MLDPASMLAEGGPFMYAILLAGMCMPLLVVGAGVLAGRGLRVPAALHHLVGTSVLVLGAVGTLQGLALVDGALRNCSAEMYATLASAGQSAALLPLIAGGFGASLTLASMAAAMGIGTAAGVKDRRVTVMHASAAIPVFLGGAGFIAAGSVNGVVVALLATLGIALVGLFASHDDAENERLAAVRGTVGWLVTLAFCSQAIQLIALTARPYYEAQARASGDMRSQLMAQVVEVLPTTVWSPVAAVLAALIATAMLVAPMAKGLLNGRAAIGTLLAGLALAPGVLVVGYTGARIADTHVKTIPAEDTRKAALAELGVTLPVVQSDAIQIRVLSRPSLTFLADGSVLFDGQPQQPGPLPAAVQRDGVNIEALPQTPLSAILAHSPGDAPPVYWVVQGPEGLRTLRIPPEREGSRGFVYIPNRIVVVVEEGIARISLTQQGQMGPASEVAWSDVPTAIANIRTQYPDVLHVHLWLPHDRTAQELVRFLDVLIAQADADDREPVWLHWRTDAPPELELLDPDDPNRIAGLDGGSAVTPSITVGSVVLIGNADRDEVQSIVDRNARQAADCQARALAKQPQLAGRVVVKLAVSKEGIVSTAGVLSDTTGSVELQDCIVQTVEQWVFPRPIGGGIVIMKWPFFFRTVGP